MNCSLMFCNHHHKFQICACQEYKKYGHWVVLVSAGRQNRIFFPRCFSLDVVRPLWKVQKSTALLPLSTRCRVSVQYSTATANVSPGRSSQSVRVDSSQTCLPHRVLTCFPGGALSNIVLLYVFANNNNNNERKSLSRNFSRIVHNSVR